ncbi:hypothetical protein SAMD00023353_6100110 [Rosellinia necatrix]|uniref:Uncharacterized protein n=1 Tax=Rosellinia necatrix TaxID=77044 RepID=A0A1W2TTU7_ROSNE|nr:hypothetical protein SAMD00023353_6100110 [Rosellinia necatrix]
MAPVTEVVLLTLVPDAVHYLIDWDSLESHRAFARGDHHHGDGDGNGDGNGGSAYRRMWDLVCPVMAAHSAPFHVTFAPPALDGRRGTPTTTTAAAAAGAAAVYTLLGKVWCRAPGEGSADEGKEDADADTDAEADVEAAFEGFLAAATATAGGWGGGGGRGVAAGWSLERDIAHGGVPCRVFAFVVGWDDDGGGGGGGASRTSCRDARLAGAVAAAFGDGGGARTVEVCLLGAWDREV